MRFYTEALPSKNTTNLKFESVVQAQTLSARGGLIARLVIKAKDDQNNIKDNKYKVELIDYVITHFKRLVSFNQTL